VYLNGAILGMKRAEVDRKFDEIVAFAEIEKFIDTPVKHYSSGMYVRLAFSVAAHLDTDILLVDEVLSVGDVKFQQKCMGRMQDRTFAGKTILFVSHNLAAIANLCPRTLLLENGRVVADGRSQDVTARYLTEGEAASSRELRDAPRRSSRGDPWRCIRRAAMLCRGIETSTFLVHSDWTLRVECDIPEALEGQELCFGFDIRDARDTILVGTNTEQYGFKRRPRAGREVFEATLPRLPLAPGRYKVYLFLGDGYSDREIIEGALQFDVLWEPSNVVERPPHVGVLHHEVVWKR